MLDSLVRVSRRVGRGADRFAGDPELPAREARTAETRAVGRHCGTVPCHLNPQVNDTAPRPAGRELRSLSQPAGPVRGARHPCRSRGHLHPRPSGRQPTGPGALPGEVHPRPSRQAASALPGPVAAGADSASELNPRVDFAVPSVYL